MSSSTHTENGLTLTSLPSAIFCPYNTNSGTEDAQTILVLLGCDAVCTVMVDGGSMKHWYRTTTLHGMTTQKTETRIFTAVRVRQRNGRL